MNTDDALTARPLFCPEDRLIPLLAKRVGAYTRMESSSVPAEVARELYEGLAMTVRIGADLSPQSDPERLWVIGRAELDRRVKTARRRLGVLQAVFLDTGSHAHRKTVSGLGAFFDRYNAEFFPQEVACDIDYPLAVPVSDALLGVDYFIRYAQSLTIENRFLTKLPFADLRRALLHWSDAFDDLHANALDIALPLAILQLIVGGAPMTLPENDEVIADARTCLAYLSDDARAQAIARAAGELARAARLTDADSAGYLLRAAKDVAARAAQIR